MLKKDNGELTQIIVLICDHPPVMLNVQFTLATVTSELCWSERGGCLCAGAGGKLARKEMLSEHRWVSVL
jgi:hypothetical protein